MIINFGLFSRAYLQYIYLPCKVIFFQIFYLSFIGLFGVFNWILKCLYVFLICPLSHMWYFNIFSVSLFFYQRLWKSMYIFFQFQWYILFWVQFLRNCCLTQGHKSFFPMHSSKSFTNSPCKSIFLHHKLAFIYFIYFYVIQYLWMNYV